MKTKIALLCTFILVSITSCMFAENDKDNYTVEVETRKYELISLPNQVAFFLDFSPKFQGGFDESGPTGRGSIKTYPNVTLNSKLRVIRMILPDQEWETIYQISLQELLDKGSVTFENKLKGKLYNLKATSTYTIQLSASLKRGTNIITLKIDNIRETSKTKD